MSDDDFENLLALRIAAIKESSGANINAALIVTGVPTLSEWGLIMLSSLMAVFGLWQVRCREGKMSL